MTHHVHKLLRSTLLYLPAQFTPPFIQFVTTIVWTHLLDPATFGFVNFIIAVQEIMACVGLTGWTLFILRFRARFIKGEDQHLLDMDQRMVMMASLMQLVLTPPLLMFLGLPCEATTIGVTALYLVTRMLISHYGDWARADQNIATYSQGQIVAAVVGSGLSILAIYVLGASVSVVIGAQAIGQLLALAILVRGLKIHFGFGCFDRSIFNDARRYAALALFGGAIGWGAANVIRILVKAIEGPEALGMISVGWTLGLRISSVVAMLLTAAAYPLAVQYMESGDRKGALSQVSFNGLLLLGVLAPCCIGTIVLSEPLVTALIAPAFREATFFILPVAISAASLRYLRIHTCDQAFLLLERTDLLLYVLTIEGVLNISLCAIGLYLDSFYGAALGMLIGSSVTCVGVFAYCFIKHDLPAPPLRYILRIVLACALMGFGVEAMHINASYLSLMSGITIGVLIYFITILLLFPQVTHLLVNRFITSRGAPAL